MIKKSAVLLVILLGFSRTWAQEVKHVVLITVDGFRPDFYLDSSWQTANIRSLMKGGAHTLGMNSVFPSMTYPSHTTIVTGVQPATHGVYYNAMFEPTGSTGKIYWNVSSVKVPTLWEAAQKKGLKATALFWPVSADAPVSYNIPDIGSMGEAVREQYSKPAGFIATVKKEVFNDTSKINYGRDVNIARIASYVIKRDRPNLMTIHLFSVDHAQHLGGREGPLIREAIGGADSAVGIIVNTLKEEGLWNNTVIIVTGDHGFVDVKTTLAPNVWLTKAGLLTDVKKDDWKAQFFTVGGSAWLYLKDKNDTATLQKVYTTLFELPDEERKLFRILNRSQLDQIGANPEVALVLSGENGGSFVGAVTGDGRRPGKGGAHGYFPGFQEIKTGFVAFGPGIKKGGVITEMNERDIAPSVAKLLGLSFPGAQGKIPAGLLTK